MLLTTLAVAGTALLTQPAYEAPDYDEASNWLCRPGREDACAIDLDTTVVAADGTMTVEPHVAAEDPGYDCFYVYPTVSTDMTANSDLVADPAEHRVIAAQFARFNSVCRPFAPMYRQVTLAALRSMMTGEGTMGADGVMAYRDVAAAFEHYLEHDNDGRPFVLIGHSQGTRMLTQLIARRIDGQPVQEQMISALLIGFNVEVPEGADRGGVFQSVPLCRAADQTGCVVSYVSFRADAPPPPTSRFGRVEAEGHQAACTNPADLSDNQAVELDAYLNAGAAFTSSADAGPWVEGGAPVETGFVRVPGLLTGQCVDNGHGSYFAVTVNGDPADPRTDEIVGDVVANGQVLADWGLHLIDVGIVQGDLIDLVETQAAAH